MAKSVIHRVTQHRLIIPGVEARTIKSDIVFPRHTHDQLGVGMVLAGGHRSWSSKGYYEAGPGQVIMLNPGEMHDGEAVSDVREWRMFYFDAELIAKIAQSEGIQSREVTNPAVRDPVTAAHISRLFHATTTEADPLAAEESLVALIVQTLRRHGGDKRAPPTPRSDIRRAIERVHAEFTAQLSLAELADMCDLSRYQLLRSFVKETGTTPHAYIMQLRVASARRLLAARKTISMAALLSGFSDQSHLTRAFVRYFGLTPGQYIAALHR